MKVVASWSGGKDSAYAYYLAKLQGHQVLSLLTMMMSEEKSNFHMIPSGILDAQAKAIGVPLIKKTTSAATYEDDFKAVLRECKAKGAEGDGPGAIAAVVGVQRYRATARAADRAVDLNVAVGAQRQRRGLAPSDRGRGIERDVARA